MSASNYQSSDTIVAKNPTPGRIQKLDRTKQTLQNQITAAKESYIANLLHTFASDQRKLSVILPDLLQTDILLEIPQKY